MNSRRPLVHRVLKPALRSVLRQGRFERRIRYAVGRGGPATRTVGPTYLQYTARHWLLVEPKKAASRPPVALHLVGGCDVPAMFAMAPLIRDQLSRPIAIIRANSKVSSARADLLLQTLEAHDGIEVARRRLELSKDSLRPVVFEPTLDLPSFAHPPLNIGVVVLSLGASIVRSAYRHREDGYLIDPGGYWLGGTTKVNPRVLEWFNDSFEPVGRLSVDEFCLSLDRLVTEIRVRAGAEVIVLNSLTVEPGDRTHNFQVRRQLEGLRRREFHVAAAELARSSGFRVLDVDRVLKSLGIAEQVDFAHFPESRYPDIAAEGVRILREMEVL